MWDQEFYQGENGGKDSKFSGAGGFLNSSSSQTPNASDKKGGAQRAQNVIPVIVRDINESGSDKPVIEGTEAHMVTFVGRVLKVEAKATNISYVIEDDSDSIDVIQWVEGEQEYDPAGQVMENIYCRVVGSVRNTQGKQHIMAFKIRPVMDLNELTTHLLEVQYARLKLREINRKATGAEAVTVDIKGSTTTSQFGNSTMNAPAAAYAGLPGLSPHQAMVHSIVQSSTSEAGVNRQFLYNSVKGKMSMRDVDNALEFLCSEGHIYSTIDEEHFRSTDSN